MKNVLRGKILKSNFIEKIDMIEISERNQNIIKKFVDGDTYLAIAKEHKISAGRVRTIIFEYYRKCYSYDKQQQKKR